MALPIVRSPYSLAYVFVKATVVGLSLSVLKYSLVTVAESPGSFVTTPAVYVVETTEYPSGSYSDSVTVYVVLESGTLITDVSV